MGDMGYAIWYYRTRYGEANSASDWVNEFSERVNRFNVRRQFMYHDEQEDCSSEMTPMQIWRGVSSCPRVIWLHVVEAVSSCFGFLTR